MDSNSSGPVGRSNGINTASVQDEKRIGYKQHLQAPSSSYSSFPTTQTNSPKPKVVTREWSDKKGAVKEGILNPCTTGREDQWGCENLCKHFGFEPVEENTCVADDWPEITHNMQQPIDKDDKNQEAAKSSVEEDLKGNQEVVAQKERKRQRKKEEYDTKNREDKNGQGKGEKGESSKGKNGKRWVAWNA